MKEKKVENITSTSVKQLFRYKYGDYLVKDDSDDVDNIYRICLHLIPNDNINNLKEDLGKEYDKVMSEFNKFTQVYSYCKQLRTMIKEEENEKKKESLKDELKRQCVRLPTINIAVILIFEHLIKNCDLKNIPIMSPTIKSPTENRMPFSFAQDMREG